MSLIIWIMKAAIRGLFAIYKGCIKILPSGARQRWRESLNGMLAYLGLQRISHVVSPVAAGSYAVTGGKMYQHDDPIVNQVFTDTEAFYNKVTAIYEESGYNKKYQLNEFWGGSNMQELLKVIKSDISVAEKVAAVHETRMFSVNTSDEELKNKVIDWYIDYLYTIGASIHAMDSAIQESPISNPYNSALRGERLLAPDFLRSVVLNLELQKYCDFPKGKYNVVELGAGYGCLARTMKLFNPDISYVIIDIPQTLYFSAVFLQLNFPEAKVLFVTDKDDLKGPVSDYDFVFIPTMFADVILDNHFELFCNTASMGEMKNVVIREWMDFVQNKLDVRYFFGLNRFLNTIDPKKQSWRKEENVCSVSFDDRWRIVKWELEPPFVRCPYLETWVARHLEVIAERMPLQSVNKAYNRFLSNQIAADVAKEDWYVYRHEDSTMFLRDNLLVTDLTQRGTLFRLWESIRLFPTTDNVDMMLAYMDKLERGKPFEEKFYYQELLDRLISGGATGS